MKVGTMYTKQQTFDLVAKHLLTQMEVARDDEWVFKNCSTKRCAYRTGDLKCAAGCLIPDDDYEEGFEGLTVAGLIREYGWSDFFGHDPIFVTSLQSIHDHVQPNDWKVELGYLAEEEGLDTSVLDV